MSDRSEVGLRRAYVDVGEVRSPLIEAGPRESAEAVVFVHGNPGSSSDFTALVAAAGELGRALAFDLPGFGKSRAPAGFEFSVQGYARFIEDARTALGVERAHLVLHDFGGPFGLLWGFEHPDAWASVVLINVGVMPGYVWHSMAKRWRTPVIGELTQAWIPRWGWRRVMQGSSPRGMPLEFVDKMYDEYDRETRRTVLKLYRATPDPGAMAEQVGASIAQLHLPALVIWGAADPFIGVEYAERQSEFFDVQRTVVLPNSGHWPFQDDPDGVREPALEFLRAQLTRTDPRSADAGAPPLQARPAQ
jgi:pimeloyl-ACP methyl ester carboxylesterase